MRTRQTPLLSLLICLLLLAGCGQSGPLYLPEPEQDTPLDPDAADGSPSPDT